MGAVVESHGWYQTAPFSWDSRRGILRRVERLPSGVATIEVAASPVGAIVRSDRALADGEAGRALARATRMLQAPADLSGLIEASGSIDGALRDDLADYGAGRMLAGTSLYEDVVKAICGTNVTWKQAVGMIAALAALDPDGAFPDPGAIIDAGEDRLREHARVGYRAPYLLEAARAAADGTLDAMDDEAQNLATPELAARLRALPGVGPATAAFCCLLMGRYDVPLVDSAVTRVAARRWFDGRRPAHAEVLERVAPAGRYTGLVLYWATMRGWHIEGGLVGLGSS